MRFKNLILICIGLMLSIWLSLPHSAYAHLIAITATTPFPAQVSVSSTTTANFTVTNLTSKTSLTIIDQSQFPANSGLFISSTTCGVLIGPGQSCNITLQLNAPSTPQIISTELREWAKPSIDGVRYPFSVVITSASNNNNIAIAVGNNDTGTFPPLLVSSTNGGYFWSVPPINGMPVSGSFSSSSCTGSGSSSICIIGGVDTSTAFQPLLVTSIDGATTWNNISSSISGITSSGIFWATSCTGSSPAARCLAAGEENFISGPPLLVVSTDNANNWANVTASISGGLPATTSLRAASCTGEGASAICVVGGSSAPIVSSPVLVTSLDGGVTWTNVSASITGLPANGGFRGISCIGTGSTAICVAVGTAGFLGGSPLVTISTDGGNSFNNISGSIAGLPPTGNLFDTSCTGSGSTAICMAVGQDDSAQLPLLILSTDGGSSWNNVIIPGLPNDQAFYSASCTGAGSSAICIAAGGAENASMTPLLVVSTNGGATWEIITAIPGLPVAGVFFGAHCSGTGSNAICIAAGKEGTGTEAPLLIVSTDGANNWSRVIPTDLPNSGVFNDVAGTSALLKHTSSFRSVG